MSVFPLEWWFWNFLTLRIQLVIDWKANAFLLPYIFRAVFFSTLVHFIRFVYLFIYLWIPHDVQCIILGIKLVCTGTGTAIARAMQFIQCLQNEYFFFPPKLILFQSKDYLYWNLRFKKKQHIDTFASKTLC